jgi:uncharacterized protein (TIGR03437 family)
MPGTRFGLVPEAAAGVPAAAVPAPVTMNGFPAVLDDLTAVPPDTAGAVGPQHVVTTLNSQVQFQTRAGEVKGTMTLEKFWSALPSTDVVTDPRILYDPFGKRWIASAVSITDKPTSALLIGVSQGADPTANWNLFRIPIDSNHVKFGDYDVLGFNSTWVTASVDVWQADQYQQTNLYVFTKADLYGGKAPFRMFHNQEGPFTPATDYDNSLTNPMYLFQEDFGVSSGLIVSEIQGNAGSELFQGDKNYVKPFDYWQNEPFGSLDFAPQLGSTQKIDTGDSRLQNCVLRNGSIWCTQHIFLPVQNPQRTAVQWWQINPAQYSITQRGRIDDPTGGTFYAYPSIAVNKNGDVLLGYNRFLATEYASGNFSFRAAGDPPNTTQADTVIKKGEAPYFAMAPVNRWGDYSQTLVDPVDDVSFWTIQEYAASPTPDGIPRWGTWWAQIMPLAAGKTCAWTLSRSAQSFTAAGGAGSVDVATTAGCNWMAAPNASWITTTNGAANGSTSGTVNFAVAVNQSTALRTGTLTIAGQTFTITQAAAPPLPDLVVTSLTAPTTATIGGQIAVAATVKNQGTAQAGAFRVGFYFSANGNTSQVLFSGSSCPVEQGLAAGVSTTCNLQVLVPPALNPGTNYVVALADDQNAITESDHSNNSRLADTGPITIQAPPATPKPAVAADGIVNAASRQGGAVAPGEVILLTGENMGPPDKQMATSFETLVAGTRLLFDGNAAPLRYVSDKKVSAIVPFAVDGQSATVVEVEYKGTKSAPVTLPVAAGAPGVFTVTEDGQGVILNQDGSPNSPDAPAVPLSILCLTVTGAGQTDPPGADGQLAPDPPPQLMLPVTATVGGLDARVVSAGPVAGMVNGMIQVYVEIPADVAPDNAVPLVLTVGPASSVPVPVAVAPPS